MLSAGRIINGNNKEDRNEEDCSQSKGAREESSARSQEGSRQESRSQKGARKESSAQKSCSQEVVGTVVNTGARRLPRRAF